ncbi:alpha-1,4 glucan phosphorylase isozyme/amyloplastic [Salix suchowensis]|uniref:Alpha-1,4 glucan phosphorylase n=2 Tax=Salix TaxID=40685 RepID=A0A9Q0UZE2_9ROSI|nr:alpha-1,4 glucan phosphorylase isozyme/amyloplastic [Salix suchowensis]KAJ6738921.1 ALPHA-14 GLUCAN PHOSPHORYLASE L-2 ISOZYME CHLOROPLASTIC/AMYLOPLASTIC [Salix koriyanagi]KAJ6738922.1 ALPHA-14 GLUCAN PHOSPHORYLASE L-2 ISOZYME CHLOROPLASTIC/AMYLOPLASTIC [Salix koriyanagi]
MATTSSHFSATSHWYSNESSVSRLIDFGSKWRKQQLFSKNSRRLVKRRLVSVSIKNVSSEPKQKLKDDLLIQEEEEVPRILNPSTPNTSSIASSIKYHAEFTPLFSLERFELPKAYFATAQSVRDALIINWNSTYECYERLNAKQAYYLSMEFLQGRALLNAIGNLELNGAYAEALSKLGHSLENVACQEPDAALGNGGLGRLASCFLDSLATLNYPAWGYGLRYKYGLFKQKITKDGQEEVAEDWLEMGNPWEILRNDVSYPVKFFGKVVSGSDGKRHWIGGEDIKAVAYDVPIPGYKTKTTINLRLWSTKAPSEDLDLYAFNVGDHTKAYEALLNAEKICYVLYPGDDSLEGKILRLKQQYTLCSASLQDIISCFERRSGSDIKWEKFPEKVAVQMNDTHPTLCIPELMRVLIDLKGLSWKEAWNITQRTVAYTNHTVLPEALEKWSVELMQKLLPRHVEIIELIDEELIRTIVSEYGNEDSDLLEKKLKEMRILENVDLPSAFAELIVKPKLETKTVYNSEEETKTAYDLEEEMELSEEIENSEEETKLVYKSEEETTTAYDLEEEMELVDEKDESNSKVTQKKEKIMAEPPPLPPKMVRMANLCVVGGHAVNGVAKIHSEIVKDEVFNAFFKLWPDKFQNKTNGVTPRRWIRFCNPGLSKIITDWTGMDDWVLNTEKLAELRKFSDNEDLQVQWKAAKRSNKMKVISFLKEKTGYSVSPDAMFDIQVKRIHEYKRQLLNILGIVYRYKKMKEMSAAERKTKYAPRVCIFGGKAFATYVQAKRIVKFITDVGATVNHDPEIGDLLKVVFVPDYNVSVAELLIPASELSQHISTAGMEASGTSNMKFAMNGCVLIGTLDGANVEIREEVGVDNFFLFGAKAHEIAGLRKERADGKFVPDPIFEEVKDFVRSGVFGPYSYDELMASLEGNEGFGRADYFLVGKDFTSYIECQEEVDKAYQDQKRWTKMSIMNTAGSYKFSSDRTIREYAREIWNIEPVELP